MTDTAQPKVLLVVEDDEGLQRQLKWAYEGYEVVCASDRGTAIEALRAHEPAVVTLDLGLPPDPDGTEEGFATLLEMLTLKPDTKIIVATGHGARESATKAVAMGAYDFYKKPVDIDELGFIVARAFHLHDLEEENRRLENGAGATVLGSIITAAPEMQKVGKTIERVASADVSVMLLGASGTGKELLARAVHEKSSRKGEFIAINCAAIPENLLESRAVRLRARRLHRRGQVERRQDRARRRRRLFLDEVGDIPLPLQVKLLRFLQERIIERIGGRQPIAVDTRIVCATHQDLEAMIADGRFREDLYYRLAEIVVKIPSLAERAGDAVLLARHFVNRFGRELNPGVQSLSPDAIDAIDAFAWPGNVRELENRIKRAVIMADGKTVTAADLDLKSKAGAGDEALPINLRAAREVADRKAIRQAMSRSDNNISGAAKLLGISRPTLYDLLKQYRLQA